MLKLEDIAEEYLHSFSFEENGKKREKGSKEIQQLLKRGAVQRGYLGKVSQREGASLMFSKVLPKSEQLKAALAREETPVLAKGSWRDFNLLRGSTTTPEKSLLNDIKRTHTVAGDCVLATELVNPHTSLSAIHSRQATVTALLEDKQANEVIDQGLAGIAKREKVRLTHWNRTNELTHPIYRKELNAFYYKWRIFPKGLNRSSIALQIKKFFHDLWLNPMIIYSLFNLLIVVLGYYWYYNDIRQERLSLSLVVGKNGKAIGKVFATYQPSSLFYWLWYWNSYDAFCISYLVLGLSYCFPLWQSWYPLEVWAAWYPNFHLGGWFKWCSYIPSIKYHYARPSSYIAGLVAGRGSNFLLFDAFLPLLAFFAGSYLWYFAYKKYKRKKSVLNLLSEHLVAFQELILGAEQISKVVASSPKLQATLGQQLHKTDQLLNSKADRPVGKLIHNLKSGNFHSRSFFFRNVGQLLQTYILLQQERDQLIPMIYEMGFVDGCALGVAKRVAESQAYDNKRKFTPGRFIGEATKGTLPVLSVRSMWHPGLDAKQAVPNDLAMNADGGPRLLVITGPNAGGKSTYVIGIGVNTILNQVIGYVAAAKFKQSFPFRRIISYINVTQNLAAGLSLGEAGMEVLRKHKEALEDNSEWGVLAILDEILNGTDPTKAEPLAKKILESRQEAYPRCLTLLTTHYMGLTKLADKDSSILNKKVVVKIPGSNGRKFDYTYKIEPGISDQNIVEDMLAEKGVL